MITANIPDVPPLPPEPPDERREHEYRLHLYHKTLWLVEQTELEARLADNRRQLALIQQRGFNLGHSPRNLYSLHSVFGPLSDREVALARACAAYIMPGSPCLGLSQGDTL